MRMKTSVSILTSVLEAFGLQSGVARALAVITIKLARLTGGLEPDLDADIVLFYNTVDGAAASIKVSGKGDVNG